MKDQEKGRRGEEGDESNWLQYKPSELLTKNGDVLLKH